MGIKVHLYTPERDGTEDHIRIALRMKEAIEKDAPRVDVGEATVGKVILPPEGGVGEVPSVNTTINIHQQGAIRYVGQLHRMMTQAVGTNSCYGVDVTVEGSRLEFDEHRRPSCYTNPATGYFSMEVQPNGDPDARTHGTRLDDMFARQADFGRATRILLHDGGFELSQIEYTANGPFVMEKGDHQIEGHPDSNRFALRPQTISDQAVFDAMAKAFSNMHTTNLRYVLWYERALAPAGQPA